MPKICKTCKRPITDNYSVRYGWDRCGECLSKQSERRKRKYHTGECYVYALVDPFTNSVRYVGQTIMPSVRLKGHIAGARSNGHCTADRAAWLKRIASRGAEPEMVILEKCAVENKKEREAYWIEYMLRKGQPLLNSELDLLKAFERVYAA